MWKNEIEELKQRKKAAYQLGGKENVAKQHRAGKMTVRERIDFLADEASFLERGILAGVPLYDNKKGDKLIDITPCPLVTVIMKVSDRRVAVTGDDFTIKGDPSEGCIRQKMPILPKWLVG
jgi:acetyl-CoA carboxylase carboxyltransferase component